MRCLSSADALDRLAAQLLVEARGLDGVVDTIEPLVARVMGAWEGPAADRLVAELGERRQELILLGSGLRSLAERNREEARRLRAAEAAAPATIDLGRQTGPGAMLLR